MERGRTSCQDLDAELTRYLQSWGLREFHDENSYYEWQRAMLSLQSLQKLQVLVEQRQGGENEAVDIEFYDFLATLPLLPVLYSQRFDYFRKIGLLLSPRLSSAQQILDFGCGVGILTCFFAQQHPDIRFVGMDRSVRSIEVAKSEAQKRRLANVQFRVSQGHDRPISSVYDCILSTQALFQSEKEPGLPSQHWHSFQREVDCTQQENLEQRTGVSQRLSLLLKMLSADGRLICFEKTWNLGRRVFFQRALSGKNLVPVCDPHFCSYLELGEMKIDGPLYEVSRVSHLEPGKWNEEPFQGEGETLYRCVGAIAERMGRVLETARCHETIRGRHGRLGPWSVRLGVWEQAFAWGLCETEEGYRGLLIGSMHEQEHIFSKFSEIGNLSDLDFECFLQNSWSNFRDDGQQEVSPGYENHLPSAQLVYEALPQKILQQESTFSDGNGKEMHIEIGESKAFQYLYWANTFDQRQLLLTDEHGADVLREYYRESLEEAQASSGENAVS